MKYRAVFFDVGETLVHPYPSFPELFEQILRRQGHHVDPTTVMEGITAVSGRFAEAAKAGRLWSTSAERSRSFWLSIYRTLLERIGITGDDRLAEQLYAEFTNLANYRLFPDVLPMLERLEREGLTLAVISNFEEWLEGLMEALGVTRFFDVRVISGVVGIEKPDPAIFRLALERTGTRATESVYVGDNPWFDAEPAARVGMDPVLIDRRDRYPDYVGVRIFSMQELPEAIGLR